ncbi:reverse transcriptase domain-containing protein [Brucella pseudogrignonensis]|uniref:reverse transcriptase domain-containing protein n=1 Tax=Brucella pseudogrignonensis TaxID=419475 RepID=UPI0028B2E987|nr:reverse transcriptase domain-containing protein [Brucella pseudogrignonensis]MDT6939074.1 reverse transcriptase domain-containing protein [Brucella pseudogrignonensis]
MPSGVIASTHSVDEWEPREKDIKRYIHFDRAISLKKIQKLANDPLAVSQHPFFPLLRFYEKWTKFRDPKKPKKTKVRSLRYASRLDAAIYACYRHKLSKCYEEALIRRGIADVPVAYRRIPKASGGNKCNIDIAKDVFSFIKNTGNCIVTVVDIKSYFESLDHKIIKYIWEELLGETLPRDHLAVFKSLTKYCIVDVDKIFSRLKLTEKVNVGVRREARQRRVDTLRANGYRQICSPQEFRNVIAGADGNYPSLIQKNGFEFGIPQGTPISDLVANFYLIDFDKEVNDYVQALGGMYRRYSDDIIVVIPVRENTTFDGMKNYLQANIKKYGARLRIQDKKVCIGEFKNSTTNLDYSHLFGEASKNGLEYLGFEYDGQDVKIKNSTLSNAWRKLKRKSYGHAWRFVVRYKDKGELWIRNNYPHAYLEKKMLQNVTFNQDNGFESWTFVKYAQRASKTFLGFNPIFSQQTRRYRRMTKTIIQNDLNKAIAKYL